MRYLREIVNFFQGRKKLSEDDLNPYQVLKFLKNFPTDSSDTEKLKIYGDCKFIKSISKDDSEFIEFLKNKFLFLSEFYDITGKYSVYKGINSTREYFDLNLEHMKEKESFSRESIRKITLEVLTSPD
jgi:hypothetical protein